MPVRHNKNVIGEARSVRARLEPCRKTYPKIAGALAPESKTSRLLFGKKNDDEWNLNWMDADE
jgi:hypothetical protein